MKSARISGSFLTILSGLHDVHGFVKSHVVFTGLGPRGPENGPCEKGLRNYVRIDFS
jgi:hypothetical protein